MTALVWYQVTQQHSNTAWLIGTCTVWQETCTDCSLVLPFCPKTRDWNVYKAVLVWQLLFGTFGTDWTHNDNCSWSLMVGTLSPMCLSSWFTWRHRTWQNLPASLLCFWVLQLRWSWGEKAKDLVYTWRWLVARIRQRLAIVVSQLIYSLRFPLTFCVSVFAPLVCVRGAISAHILCVSTRPSPPCPLPVREGGLRTHRAMRAHNYEGPWNGSKSSDSHLST